MAFCLNEWLCLFISVEILDRVLQNRKEMTVENAGWLFKCNEARKVSLLDHNRS